MDLSYEEIELLMEGLDAIKASAMSSRLLGSLIGAAFSKDEEQRDEMLDKMSPDEEQEHDQKLLEERIIFLKAKLLQMRDRAEVPSADDIKETTNDQES